MLLNVLQIPELGRSYSFDSPQWAIRSISRALGGEGVKAIVQYDLKRYDRLVQVNLQYEVHGYTQCARCMRSVLVVINGSEELFYDEDVTSKHSAKTEKDLKKIALEEEIDIEDLDIGWYQNGKLSLEDALCEAIVLEMPMRVHCGLSIVLAQEEEGCQNFETEIPKTSDNIFAKLLKIE